MEQNASGCFFSEHSVVGLPLLLDERPDWLCGLLQSFITDRAARLWTASIWLMLLAVCGPQAVEAWLWIPPVRVQPHGFFSIQLDSQIRQNSCKSVHFKPTFQQLHWFVKHVLFTRHTTKRNTALGAGNCFVIIGTNSSSSSFHLLPSGNGRPELAIVSRVPYHKLMVCS